MSLIVFWIFTKRDLGVEPRLGVCLTLASQGDGPDLLVARVVGLHVTVDLWTDSGHHWHETTEITVQKK